MTRSEQWIQPDGVIDSSKSEQVVVFRYCNPLERKTWIRTVMALILFFCITLGTSLHIFGKNKDETEEYSMINTIDTIETYKKRFLALRPLISVHNMSDPSALIDSHSPQSRALYWIIYKDKIIEIQERNVTSTNDDRTNNTVTYNNDDGILANQSNPIGTKNIVEQGNNTQTNTTSTRIEYYLDEMNFFRFQQRYAMLVFYYSCSGETWTAKQQLQNEGTPNNNDNTTMATNMTFSNIDAIYNESECSFTGFVCNNDDNDNQTTLEITSIELSNHHIAGQLPGELALLASLRSINMANNLLIGTIPSELFQKLTNLEILNLEQNEITSTIPSSISNCVHLKEINFGYNQLNGFLPILSLSLLRSLEVFIVRNNVQLTGLNGIHGLVQNWSQLQYLNIDLTQITGTIPSNFGELVPHLVSFTMDDTIINGTIPFESMNQLSNLKELVITNNKQIEGTVPDISKLTNLEIVSFQGFQLFGTLPENIGLLPNLKELHISMTSISGSLSTEFGTLVSLTKLELFDNPMTGTIPTELGILNALQKFLLYDTEVTGMLPTELCNRPQLSIGIDCELLNPVCESDCF